MSISVDLRLDFKLSDRICMGWRVLQLGFRQERSSCAALDYSD